MEGAGPLMLVFSEPGQGLQSFPTGPVQPSVSRLCQDACVTSLSSISHTFLPRVVFIRYHQSGVKTQGEIWTSNKRGSMVLNNYIT